jgi:SAM-dependent methyltransferase
VSGDSKSGNAARTATHRDAEPLGWQRFRGLVSQCRPTCIRFGRVSRSDLPDALNCGGTDLQVSAASGRARYLTRAYPDRMGFGVGADAYGQFMGGTAEKLPFEDPVVDVALAQVVVHFMADPVVRLREMARVTRNERKSLTPNLIQWRESGSGDLSGESRSSGAAPAVHTRWKRLTA